MRSMGNSKQLPLGFRFLPKDVELIRHFLIKKLKNQPLCSDAVVEADVYSTEPWNLKGNKDGDIGGEIDKGYYFVHRERKYSNRNGTRSNRRVIPRHGRGGFWKMTGVEQEIHDKRNNILVGVKKSLKFFRFTDEKKTTINGEKTDWIMHEYTLPPGQNEFQPWVLCSIRFNGNGVKYQRQKEQHQKEDEKLKQQEAPDHHHRHRYVEPVILQQEHQEVLLHDQQKQQLLMSFSWPANSENTIFKQKQDFRLENDKMKQLDNSTGGGLDYLFGLSNKMEDASACSSTNHKQIVDVAAKRRRLISDDNCNAHDQHGLMKKLRSSEVDGAECRLQVPEMGM